MEKSMKEERSGPKKKLLSVPAADVEIQQFATANSSLKRKTSTNDVSEYHTKTTSPKGKNDKPVDTQNDSALSPYLNVDGNDSLYDLLELDLKVDPNEHLHEAGECSVDISTSTHHWRRKRRILDTRRATQFLESMGNDWPRRVDLHK
jgi:hypothetical protein